MTAQFPFNGRVNLHEEQRNRTRARLYEAAMQEYRRVGFEQASVARVVREAGVSRPSFREGYTAGIAATSGLSSR